MKNVRARARATYAGAVGVAVGMLLTGLLLPFALGDRTSTSAAPAPTSPLVDGGPATGTATAGEVTTPSDDVLPAASGPAESTTAEAPPTTRSEDDAAAPATDEGPASVRAATGRTASDVGVTADTVKVGFLLLDIGGLDQVGIDVGVNVEQQKAAVKAFVDELNERGGVNGRRIDPVYRPVNLLDQDAGRVACAELTQDHKVFISTGHLPRPEDVHCFTVQNRASLLTTNLYADEAYARSEGRLVTCRCAAADS